MNYLSWSTLFSGRMSYGLCNECTANLPFIAANRCERCCKITEKRICHDCYMWESHFANNDPLIKNVSTFTYNEYMQQIIAKWKYRGDYMLGKIFTPIVKRTFFQWYGSLFSKSVIVPIPLSEKRMMERHFNQSVMLAQMISSKKHKIQYVLVRIDEEKQAKKNRTQRIFAKNPFKLVKNINKTVILVDDIYTTGSTIRHAATLLKKGGCPAVYSYTLIRG